MQKKEENKFGTGSIEFKYDNSQTYQENMKRAYLQHFNPEASEEECKKADQMHSLMIPMKYVPWFKGMFPVEALEATARSEILSDKIPVVFIRKSKGYS